MEGAKKEANSAVYMTVRLEICPINWQMVYNYVLLRRKNKGKDRPWDT